MVEEIILQEIKQDKSGEKLDKLVNLYSKDRLKKVIEANKYIVSNELSEKLIKYFDINELYKMSIANEKLIKEHINDLNKELFYEMGFKNLSADFINDYTMNMELLDMSNIEVDRRPNIGSDKSPLYLNAGCCLGQKYYNGVDIYIPYGLWCDIFEAIEISTRCISNEIYSLNNSISKLDSIDEIDDSARQTLKTNLEFDLEKLKKHKMILDNFRKISYEI